MLILALLVMVLLISSEVSSARDLTETSTNTKKEIVEQKGAAEIIRHAAQHLPHVFHHLIPHSPPSRHL
ncbi:hypothetical protein QL285_029328 [Trifolium repens]|nr:hypothetical protein QL285_029328 [Trifolium repens]